jgi:hypothetical protein
MPEHGDDTEPARLQFGLQCRAPYPFRHAEAKAIRFGCRRMASRHGVISGRNSRARNVLRLLQRLALAIVTVIVCGGVTGAARDIPHRVAIDVAAATACESTEIWVSSHGRPQNSRHTAARAVVEPNDEESHFGEEEAPRGELAAELPSRWDTSPRGPDTFRCGETQADPSRFEIDTTLPRGPPT